MLWTSYLVRPHSPQDDAFLSNALSQAAFILLAVTIVNLLWTLLGGDPITHILSDLENSTKLFYETLERSSDLLRDSRKTGLISIFARRETLPPGHWVEQLRSATKEVDLMDYTLFTWTKGINFEQEILNLVTRGVNIRLLLMDDANQYFGSFIERPDLPGVKIIVTQEQGQARLLLEHIKTQINGMKPKPSGSFEVRTVLRGLTASRICRTDDKMTVNTYLYSLPPASSPVLIIKGHDSPLFQSYQQEFNLLWKLNVPPSQVKVVP